ncbi:peptidylprolyl isomerase [uncultured Brachyspira sp.]|uniref:peptidylprolyl isomerase n=1 Tax=uncultured Brachyspira sp. TaxID=221953 RepID=UPI0025D9CE55|nr:peptidylprolyl isomerase [uncultured Brachyspira sp.]
MMKKIFLALLFTTISSLFLYSDDTNWVIRIRDSQGNVKKIMTVEDCLSEISNLTVLRGAPDNAVNMLLTNDFQLWQFASQIIDQELVYLKAVEEGYDKDEEIINLISKERDNQLSQLYMQEKVSDDFAVVTDAEKRRFFNNNRARIQASVGHNVAYEQVAMEIETTILQERMRNEYDKILESAKTNYNLKYSVTSDPCITIEDETIPLSEFNDMFNESLKQAGANIPAALRIQARDGMFKAFVAREVMVYEAKKAGFYDTPQAKAIENFLTRNAVTANYIDKTIRESIPIPTEEEINEAYERYGKMYNIDSLPYADAQKALASLVTEAKTQQKYQILVTDLRYRYNIEKNLDLLLNKK